MAKKLRFSIFIIIITGIVACVDMMFSLISVLDIIACVQTSTLRMFSVGLKESLYGIFLALVVEIPMITAHLYLKTKTEAMMLNAEQKYIELVKKYRSC